MPSTCLPPSSQTYDAGAKPASSRFLDMTDRSAGGRRRRSSSILQVYHEPPETLEQMSDQAILYDVIPGSSQEASWTLTNMTYMVGSYIMFHYVRGIPFDFNGGAFDNLNMWEQIDNGAQYTPTKKFLLSVPIVLFLLSTHYTHYDSTYFVINFLATLAVVIPKLPFSHRMRFSFFSEVPEEE
ncbi:hypothetical protein Trco_002926 [Trichoderma cornu-damae]|uniref:Orm1 type endoplasmic reticulum protein n=1 Tax=Trichoderma cornu-damae TaxID=654480 RepID=A0A9P8QQB8_9HYPO|nr:hypothetical protein Trco_002926 [Trichoderma cornu-damae]